MHIRIKALSVHLLTATGAVLSMFAMLAAVEEKWSMMFLWLVLALIVDGIDGTFARALDVKRRLPRFSGEKLDQVVDYVTYVFVPVLALQLGGYLQGIWGGILASLILLSSLYHFCDYDNKSDDHCFVGFPAIWNVVALYLFALSPPAWFNYAALLVCVFFTFIPIRWVHPVRVEKLRVITLVVTVAWSIAAIGAVAFGFPSPLWAQIVLVGAALYYVAMTIDLSLRAHA